MADVQGSGVTFARSSEKGARQILKTTEKKAGLKSGVSRKWKGEKKIGAGRNWDALKKSVEGKNGSARKVG